MDIAVVGLGLQGTGIAREVAKLKHRLVGAVDVDDRRGHLLSEYVPDAAPDALVHGSVGELLTAQPHVDVVFLATTTDLDATVRIATELVSEGVNVISLSEEAFTPGEWAPPLDQAAKHGGATFFAGGIQDVLWLHLSATAAAIVPGITRMTLRNVAPLEALSRGIGEQLGLGLSPAQWKAAGHGDNEHSIVDGPVAELARLLGLNPTELEGSLEPTVGQAEYVWRVADTTLPAGSVQGFRHSVVMATSENVVLSVELVVEPGDVDAAEHAVVVDGVTQLTLRMSPIPREATNSALISRLEDVVHAAPGIVFSADLPAPRPAIKLLFDQ